jgi:heat shock protein HtpX
MPNVHGNMLRTAILFAAVASLILAAGAAADGVAGLLAAVVLAFGVCVLTYFWSDRIALSAMRSRPVSEWEYPQLYRLVRELSSTARTPVPRLYVSPAIQPNAFATGRNRRRAAICCTEGILRLLDPDELRGVLSHELSHVQSRDILVSSVAAGVATVITFLASFAWLLPFGRGSGRLLKVLLMMVLGPLAALIIQVAIARTREYQADSAGALLTGDPLALARALRKIDAGAAELPLAPDARRAPVGHLMIASPFVPAGVARLFLAHPPAGERIRRLEALAGYRR